LTDKNLGRKVAAVVVGGHTANQSSFPGEKTMRLIALLLLLWLFEITVQTMLNGHIHPMIVLGLILIVLVTIRRH